MDKVKKDLIKLSIDNNFVIDFSAKPFANQPGSAIHIHISLHNTKGDHLYKKINNQESDILLWSIGGLCKNMKNSMKYFAPSEKSLLRYKFPSYETPTVVSWGKDNRTTAIRIPQTTLSPNNRRIEHRVPCSDANPKKVIEVILNSIDYGLKNKIQPPEPIYGIASDPQYNCEPLL